MQCLPIIRNDLILTLKLTLLRSVEVNVGHCHSAARGHVLHVSPSLVTTVHVGPSEVPVLGDDQRIVQVGDGAAGVTALEI